MTNDEVAYWIDGLEGYMAYRLARVPPALAGKEAMEAIQKAAPERFVHTAELDEWLQEEAEAKGLEFGPLGRCDG